MNKITRALGALSLMTLASFASATVLFYDDFEADTAALNQTNLTNWDVTRTAVDVVASGQFGLVGNGKFLDMDGSQSSAGKIETKSTFNLVDGQMYELSYRASGNGRNADTDSMDFSIGSLSGNISGPGTVDWAYYTFAWTQVGDQSDVIIFDHLGGDNIGLLLDEVKLEAVPEPATMTMLGLGALALIRCKRKA